MKREELLGAIARGWCTLENENKQMDPKLAEAIADQIQSVSIDERTCMEDLRQNSIKKSQTVVSAMWKRAYLNLADAADRIAAMDARTQVSN